MTLRHPRALIGALASLAFASACGDDEPKPAVRDEPAGPPPSWAEAELGTRWVAPGLGEAIVPAAAADLDGDGDDELIYAGRGIAAVDPDGPRLLWAAKFELSPYGSDTLAASGVRVIPSATGDETPDVLAANSDGQVVLIDGADGTIAWSRSDLELDFLLTDIALVDADGDGVRDVFPAHGKRALSGATGADLWSADLWQGATHLAEADLDGDDRGDLLIGLEPPAPIGGIFAAAAEGEEAQLFAIAGDGTELFRFTPEGRTLAVGAADIDGDGIDEAFLANDTAELFAIDASGTQLWRLPVATPDGVVWVIAGFDTDGDGAEELYLSGGDFTNGWFVARVDTDGTLAWLQPVGDQAFDFAFVDGRLLAATGVEDAAAARGRLVALAPDTGAELWDVETERAVRGVTPLRRGAGTELALAMRDSIVRAVDAKDGGPAWSWATGGFATALTAVDLDGDGSDEVVRGDEDGYVTVLDGGGAQLRTWRPDLGFSGLVTGLAAADLDGDGTPEVVVSGDRAFEFDGLIAAAGADGSERWSVRVENPLFGVLAVDLDGDGDDELVAGERAGAGTCAVVAFDGAGKALWKQEVSDSCMTPVLAAGDVDGDGKPEIGYGDTAGSRVALLGADGAVRWSREAAYDTWWLQLRPGALVHGGAAGDTAGHVTLRDGASGDKLVHRQVDPAPSDNEWTVYSGWTVAAAAVPDLDGDGADELAVSSVNGAVLLLDGRSLETRWTRRLEPEGLPGGDAHHAGPVLFVPGTDHAPAYLAVAQSHFVRTDGAIFALDLDGTIVGEQKTAGEAHAIALVRDRERTAVAVAAGLGVHTVEAR